MKTTAPKQIMQPNNGLINQSLFYYFKKPLLLFFFLLYAVNMLAQDGKPNSIPKVLEVKIFLSTLKSSEQTSRDPNSNGQRVEDLITKIQPSIYLTSGIVKTYGEKPNNLYIDIRSISDINNSKISKDNIELMVIKINTASDLNSKIDLSTFSNYKNLKYVYIISEIQSTENDIIKLIQNNNAQYSIFYKIQKGA